MIHRPAPGLLDRLTHNGVEPCIGAVPTRCLAAAFYAGDSVGLIARAFRVSVADVENAIRFEEARARGWKWAREWSEKHETRRKEQ